MQDGGAPRDVDGWRAALGAGFLAGLLWGEVYLVLGLLRIGGDLLVTAPDARAAIGHVLYSAGIYGLLFAGAGTLLAVFLKILRRRSVFAVVTFLLGGPVALAFLTVRRQLDGLEGLPMGDPDRWLGAWWDVLLALVLGLAAGFLTAWWGRRWRPRRRPVLPALVALLGLLAAGELLLGRGRDSPRPEAPRRAVVVGLDGLTFRVLSPLLRAGRVPAFERLVEEGAWGTLMTYGTASSPRVWTSMATGKRTRDHGIDDFVKTTGSEAVPFKSTDRKVRAIWNIFSRLGRRVAVVDWLFTFPPEEVDGVVVSRLHLRASGRTHPPELEAALEPFLPADAPEIRFGGEPVREDRADLLASVERTFDVAEYILGENTYDLAMIFEDSSDAAQHLYWKDYEPQAFDAGLWGMDGEADTTVIRDVYEAYDRRLGQLMEKLSDDTLLIVLSDHGLRAARRPKYTFHLDRLLADLGYTAMHDGKVDHAASRAFPLTETLWKPTMGVHLNVPGREVGALRREIAGVLGGVHLDDGTPIFSRVRASTGENGEADVELALSRHLRDGESLDRRITVDLTVQSLRRYLEVNVDISGNHDRQGVLFVHGPGVRPGFVGQKALTTPLQELVWNLTDKVDAVDTLLPSLRRLGLLDQVTTLDLAPMVLHALGEKVARDMSGSPREGLWQGLPEVEWTATYEDGTMPEPSDAEDASDAEELERLRSLGYVN